MVLPGVAAPATTSRLCPELGGGGSACPTSSLSRPSGGGPDRGQLQSSLSGMVMGDSSAGPLSAPVGVTRRAVLDQAPRMPSKPQEFIHRLIGTHRSVLTLTRNRRFATPSHHAKPASGRLRSPVCHCGGGVTGVAYLWVYGCVDRRQIGEYRLGWGLLGGDDGMVSGL